MSDKPAPASGDQTEKASYQPWSTVQRDAEQIKMMLTQCLSLANGIVGVKKGADYETAQWSYDFSSFSRLVQELSTAKAVASTVAETASKIQSDYSRAQHGKEAATAPAPTQKAFSTEGTDASIRLWLQKVLDYCAKGGDYLHDAKRYLEYMKEAKEEMRDLAGQAQRSMMNASEAVNRADAAIQKAEGYKESKTPTPARATRPEDLGMPAQKAATEKGDTPQWVDELRDAFETQASEIEDAAMDISNNVRSAQNLLRFSGPRMGEIAPLLSRAAGLAHDTANELEDYRIELIKAGAKESKTPAPTPTNGRIPDRSPESFLKL